MTVNHEAIENLARVVRDAPEANWNMSSVARPTSCGTVRCAIGWAIVDPWFRTNTQLSEIDLSFTGCLLSFDLDNTESDIRFLSEIFSIPIEDAENLFASDLNAGSDESLVSKTEVLWNITELLEGRTTLPYYATEAGGPYATGLSEAETNSE